VFSPPTARPFTHRDAQHEPSDDVAGVVAVVPEPGHPHPPGVGQLEEHQAQQQGGDDLLAQPPPEAIARDVEPVAFALAGGGGEREISWLFGLEGGGAE